MENQEKGLTVNIGEYKGEKPIEVVYRIGNAPKALDELPIKQPESISVSGVIRTPLDWLEKRIDTIDQKRANIKVNREKKIDKEYTAVVLENEYLKIEILPEIGGRIYSALDKTTGYDFFYKQHVIKPALTCKSR